MNLLNNFGTIKSNVKWCTTGKSNLMLIWCPNKVICNKLNQSYFPLNIRACGGRWRLRYSSLKGTTESTLFYIHNGCYTCIRHHCLCKFPSLLLLWRLFVVCIWLKQKPHWWIMMLFRKRISLSLSSTPKNKYRYIIQ